MIIVEIYDAWYTKSTAGFTCPPWYLGDKGHLTHEEASVYGSYRASVLLSRTVFVCHEKRYSDYVLIYVSVVRFLFAISVK